MSVRPTLLKDIRRTAVDNHQQNLGNGQYNRFAPLDPRGRTFSTGKRLLSGDSTADPAPKTPRLDSSVVFGQLKVQETALKEVTAGLEELNKLTAEPGTDPKWVCVSKILKGLADSQTNLSSAVLDALKLREPVNQAKLASTKEAQAKPHQKLVESAAVTGEKKLKQVLRDAEKKTVIFDLNLGPIPTMNRDTLSRKVTMALSEVVKAGKHDYDIKDAEDVLDDVLSCSKLEFLGKATKKFFNKRNPKDERNDKMCTIPVRMDFKDKETRMQAETSLRKICNVSCSVPYPRKLRAFLGDLVKVGKTKFHNSYIRTRIDIDSLSVDVHAKTETGWVDLNLSQSIPLTVLDNTVQVPVIANTQGTANTDNTALQMEEDAEDEAISLS
jgi:hypothetical protein